MTRFRGTRRALTLADLLSHETGTDLTPYDVARLSRGRFSRKTIMREIDRGTIKATHERRGKTRVYWIAFEEARRYVISRNLHLAA